METNKYIKPEVEIIELEIAEVIASSPNGTDIDKIGDANEGAAYSKRRSFWGDKD